MRRLVPAMDYRQVKAEARPRCRVQRGNSSATIGLSPIWSSTEATSPGSMQGSSRRRGFEEIRPIFEEELRLVDDDENIQSWEDAYHRVRAEVSLATPDGHLVPEFLLHRRQRSLVAVE